MVHSASPGTGLSQGCPTVGAKNESLAPKAVIDWLNGRYEEPVPAPKKLGSKKHPPIGPAPGQYVLES